MAMKDIINAGIGFEPGTLAYVITRGLGALTSFVPGVSKFTQVNRTQKVVQSESKPKAIQTVNPFKVVK